MLSRNPHDFRPPMAGQGTVPMCSRCGRRQTPDAVAEPCDGPRLSKPVAEVRSDYDPYA